MLPFEQCTYRTQVRRLRDLGYAALERYPIKVRKMKFINHGENATFQVIARDGSKYLLRTHRSGYHTLPALKEELQWLQKLSAAGVKVPKPVKSKSRQMIEQVNGDGVSRYCSVLEWIDGRFLSKSISEKHMFQIGALLGDIQKVGRKLNVKHRRYWTSEGLVGKKSKFGSIDKLAGIKRADQQKITAERKYVFSKLKSYEQRFPEKMGLVHADLHFGNLFKTKSGEIAAIDFDDCGYGFLIYDLVIPLVGLEYHLLEAKRIHQYSELKQALIEGYKSKAEVTKDDLIILPHLITARKLLMLGWLESRSDNPRLRGRVQESVQRALMHIRMPIL